MIVAVACSSHPSTGPTVKLDGSPRVPNVEGVVTSVSLKAITIDRQRFKLSPSLQSFSTYDGSAAAVLSRKDQYVQAGVKNGVVGWLAGIGAVVRPAGVVFYLGDLVDVQKGRAVFRDGTTLRVGQGVDASVRGHVRVDVDAARKAITAITAL